MCFIASWPVCFRNLQLQHGQSPTQAKWLTHNPGPGQRENCCLLALSQPRATHRQCAPLPGLPSPSHDHEPTSFVSPLLPPSRGRVRTQCITLYVSSHRAMYTNEKVTIKGLQSGARTLYSNSHKRTGQTQTENMARQADTRQTQTHTEKKADGSIGGRADSLQLQHSTRATPATAHSGPRGARQRATRNVQHNEANHQPPLGGRGGGALEHRAGEATTTRGGGRLFTRAYPPGPRVSLRRGRGRPGANAAEAGAGAGTGTPECRAGRS